MRRSASGSASASTPCSPPLRSTALVLALAVLALGPTAPALAHTAADLRQRSIYQVLTDRFARSDGMLTACDPAERAYCGGTWRGIEGQLEYIQGMGFDTVWISPIVANVELPPNPAGEAYHGYWAADIYQLNSHFGTMQDLQSLSGALHSRGMYLMVDVVANHLGAPKDQPFMPGEHYGPFTSPHDFHPRAFPTDWDDQEQVEQCWLGPEMPDLNTESPAVIRTLHHWVSTMVQHFQIDMIRIDTVKHVRKSFWPDFVRAAGVPAVGEVLHGDPAYLAPYQKEAVASLLDFAAFFHLRRAFQTPRGNIGELVDMIGRVQRMFPSPALMGSFLDNHDFPRMAGLTPDPALVKNAAVFPFVNDGFPIVYQGQELGLSGGEDPMNREAIWQYGHDSSTDMYHLFRRVNRARRAALTSHTPYLGALLRATRLNPHTLVLTKPPLLSVLTNYGSRAAPVAVYIPPQSTGFRALLPVVDVISGAVYATDPRGGLAVPIVNGEPRVFLPLGVHRAQEGYEVGEWGAPRLETDVKAQGGTGEGVGSPGSPGRHASKSPSFGRMMSWLGIGKSG